MAQRPIFHSVLQKPFYETVNVDFQFYPGFSVSQKQKSIISLHEEYSKLYPDSNLLEISSKSQSSLGVSLSAFNLNIKTSKRSFSVECAFQGSKVFEKGGPYADLLDKSSREAKKDPRLRESGKLIAFKYFDIQYPLEPKDFFYNWIYINALNLNKELTEDVLKYDSFSDIEFNPEKSLNCQAKAVAIFVGLSKQNLCAKALESPDNFLEIVYGVGANQNQQFNQMEFKFNISDN